MLYFLKLGGSLITDKDKPHSPRKRTLRRIGTEIAMALEKCPDINLIIGHGSGSFGHVPARLFYTREGVSTRDEWLGFLSVWNEAAALNKIVCDILNMAGLPIISFPPSSMVIAEKQKIMKWEISPIKQALQSNLIPVIYGDVIFDLGQGGTILSTEELFFHLATYLYPKKILIAGIEEGVWETFPDRRKLIQKITKTNFSKIKQGLGGSTAIDVTGGMLTKVATMLSLVNRMPSLEVMIFSGNEPKNITNALVGKIEGTIINNL